MVLVFDDVGLKLWHRRMFVAGISCYLPQFSNGVVVFVPLFLHLPQLLLHSLHLWLLLLQDTRRCSFHTNKRHRFHFYLQFLKKTTVFLWWIFHPLSCVAHETNSEPFLTTFLVLTISLIHKLPSVLQKNNGSTFRSTHWKSHQTGPSQEKLKVQFTASTQPQRHLSETWGHRWRKSNSTLKKNISIQLNQCVVALTQRTEPLIQWTVPWHGPLLFWHVPLIRKAVEDYFKCLFYTDFTFLFKINGPCNSGV